MRLKFLQEHKDFSYNPGYEPWQTVLKNYRKRKEKKDWTWEEFKRWSGGYKESFNTLKKYYGYQCLRCHKKEPEITLEADHVIPRFKGGPLGFENIQPLCKGCNGWKKMKTIDYRLTYLIKWCRVFIDEIKPCVHSSKYMQAGPDYPEKEIISIWIFNWNHPLCRGVVLFMYERQQYRLE